MMLVLGPEMYCWEMETTPMAITAKKRQMLEEIKDILWRHYHVSSPGARLSIGELDLRLRNMGRGASVLLCSRNTNEGSLFASDLSEEGIEKLLEKVRAQIPAIEAAEELQKQKQEDRRTGFETML